MLPTIQPDNLIGKTFLRKPSSDGIRLRAKIIEQIKSDDDQRTNDPRFIKFRCTVNDGEFEDIVTYVDIINHIEKDDDECNNWKFKSINGHEGTLSKEDHNYKGLRFNLLINWDAGERTYEPLDLIAKDDPVSCAVYAKKNGILNQPGWKRFKRIISRKDQFTRMINNTNVSKKTKENYLFGVMIPQNHQHAMELDLKAGNNK